MNVEIQKLIKKQNCQSIDVFPKRLEKESLINLYLNLVNRASILLYQKKYSQDQIIHIMCEVLYITINALAEMHIYMDYFLDILINNDFYYHAKDKCHFNFYDKIRQELHFLQKRNYFYNNVNVSLTYFNFLKHFYKKKGFHQSSSYLSSESFLNKYFCAIVQGATDLLNSDDIIEDIDYFSNLLFSVFSFFVQIGYNPYSDIHKIIIRGEKVSKIYNKRKTKKLT